MKNVKFTTDNALQDAVNIFVPPSSAKQITFIYKNKEHTAYANKKNDSFYKVIHGPLTGKEIKVTALICRE